MNTADHIEHCIKRILELQQENGQIWWIDGGVFDPWNHTLCAMALSVAGRRQEAEHAYACLQAMQREDGALPGQCGASVPLDKANRKLLPARAKPLIDSNFTAFALTGIWHHYLIYQDKHWLTAQGTLIEKCLDFVLDLQSPHGEIAWRAKEEGENLEQVDALKTGNCSIYKSLMLGAQIYAELAKDGSKILKAAKNVQTALTGRPWRFDRTWPDKSRYAMDWYYPVLSGVITGEEARHALHSKIDEFVDYRFGCRCVSDEPWFTTAETCELVMSLLAVEERKLAKTLLERVMPLRAEQGGFWMGWQSVENIHWPHERPSWTAAALVLAMDAFFEISPASQILVGTRSMENQQRCKTTSEPVASTR